MTVLSYYVLTLLKTFLVLIFIPSLVLIFVYTSWNFDYWKKRNVPYVKPWPFFGNLHFIMRKSFTDFFENTYGKFKGDYYGIFLGRVPVLVVQSKDLAKRIMLKDFDYFQDRSLYSGHSDPLGSLNLFTLNNPTWSSMRRQITPMFTTARMKILFEFMDENSIELVKRIKRDHVDGNESVDLKMLFTLYTTDTIGSTVFGLKAQVLRDANSPLWVLTQHMVRWKWDRALEFITIFFVPSLAELFKLKFFSAVATDHVRETFWSVVKIRRAAGTVGQHRDLVDMLLNIQDTALRNGEEMPDDLILAQAALFILGGVETSSTTLAYCLYQLSYNPEIQERLYREIEEADEAAGRQPLNFETIRSMKLLQMCINETLRRYPPVPYVDRRCAENYKLDEDFVIEKGVPVYINVVGLHLDEKLFPEPHKWNPYRFAKDNAKEIESFSFLPFGDGPRFCIGKRYGLMQVSTALVHIIRTYNVVPKPGFPHPDQMSPDPKSVILSPKRKIQVVFVPRQPA